MNSILFLDDTSAERPGLALACLQAVNLPDLRITAASSHSCIPDKNLRSLLAKMDLSWPKNIFPVQDLDLSNIDLVIIF